MRELVKERLSRFVRLQGHQCLLPKLSVQGRREQWDPFYALDEEVREVFEYSYPLLYVIENQTIQIVGVIHGAQPLPDSPTEIKG